jgi:WD40 repeat protein
MTRSPKPKWIRFARLASLSFCALATSIRMQALVRTVAAQKKGNACVGELRRYLGHKGTVYDVAFARDGKQFCSCGWDATVRLWDTETGKEIKSHHDHTEIVMCVAFSPDGQYVLSGGGMVYNAATDKFRDGKDHDLRLWAADSLQEVRRFKGHTGMIFGVAFSPDGTKAVSGCNDHTIRLWNVADGKEQALFRARGWVKSVAFSRDGKYLLSGSGHPPVIQLWDVKTGEELRALEGHSEHVSSIAFSADGERALSSSLDNTMRLWEIKTGKQLRSFKHPTGLNTATFCADERFAATGSGSQLRPGGGGRWESAPGDWLVRIWDLSSGTVVATFPGHRAGLMAVRLAPDGRRLLTASDDGSIRLWGLPPLKPVNKGKSPR